MSDTDNASSSTNTQIPPLYIGPPPAYGALPVTTVVYIFLGLGGILPLLFLAIVAIILQCRKRRKRPVEYAENIRVTNRQFGASFKRCLRPGAAPALPKIVEELEVDNHGYSKKDPYWIELSGGRELSVDWPSAVKTSGPVNSVRSVDNSNVYFRNAMSKDVESGQSGWTNTNTSGGKAVVGGVNTAVGVAKAKVDTVKNQRDQAKVTNNKLLPNQQNPQKQEAVSKQTTTKFTSSDVHNHNSVLHDSDYLLTGRKKSSKKNKSGDTDFGPNGEDYALELQHYYTRLKMASLDDVDEDGTLDVREKHRPNDVINNGSPVKMSVAHHRNSDDVINNCVSTAVCHVHYGNAPAMTSSVDYVNKANAINKTNDNGNKQLLDYNRYIIKRELHAGDERNRSNQPIFAAVSTPPPAYYNTNTAVRPVTSTTSNVSYLGQATTGNNRTGFNVNNNNDNKSGRPNERVSEGLYSSIGPAEEKALSYFDDLGRYESWTSMTVEGGSIAADDVGITHREDSILYVTKF